MDRTSRNDRVTTCDRCGETRVKTSSKHTLPSRWACVEFGRMKLRVLCDGCQRAVLEFIDHFD